MKDIELENIKQLINSDQVELAVQLCIGLGFQLDRLAQLIFDNELYDFKDYVHHGTKCKAWLFDNAKVLIFNHYTKFLVIEYNNERIYMFQVDGIYTNEQKQILIAGLTLLFHYMSKGHINKYEIPFDLLKYVDEGTRLQLKHL